MKQLTKIIALSMMVMLTACDPHEWPDAPKRDFWVNLDFDFSPLPVYQEITISQAANRTRAPYRAHVFDNPVMRYIIRCYDIPADTTKTEEHLQAQFVFTNTDLQATNYRCKIHLNPGRYRFKVWADYVESDAVADVFYDTSRFSDIFLKSTADNYSGSSEMSTAFIGQQDVTVEDIADKEADPNVSARIVMQRPMAKFKFVTTDIADFVGKYLGITDPERINEIDFSNYRVLFRYTGYLPTHFNMFSNKPFDAAQGYQFFSSISEPTYTEATLGFDYVFVNGHESSVSVAVGIYDASGMLLSFSNPIEVPLKRNHITIVRDKFLSQGGTGNVNISYEYDGDYNHFVK